MDDAIIVADRLIDGLGGPARKGVALSVKNGFISRIDALDRTPLPESGPAEVLRFPNATLLPGLIDCHTHTNMPANGRSGEDVIPDGDDLRLLRSARNARTALRSGVTTMCDNGAWNRTGFALKEGILHGEVAGPNLLACGRPVTVTGGHLWYMGSEADGVDGVRQATRQLLKEGADFIKVMATGGSTLTSYPFRPAFAVEELKAIGAEAQNQGRVVAAHCRSNKGMQNVLEAGYNGIFHAFFVDEEGLPSFDPEIVERIAHQGVWVNPTMHIGRSGIWALERKKEEGVLTEEEETKLLKGYENSKVRLEQCSRMVDMGVRFIAGSDCGWGNYPFGQLAYEIECMVMAGLSPMQAIESATHQASIALGIQDTVGALEPGKKADLLVVEGDPSANILDLANVLAVFKAGARV